MSKAKPMFFTLATLSFLTSWIWEARISRAAALDRPACDRRETRGERGIGREVPNELREPRRSFMEGSRLKWCITALASLMELRLAGISMA